MSRTAKKTKPYLDLWATNEALKRHNRTLRQSVSDLRWECRALRVQLYAETKYAEQFADYHRRDEQRRAGDPDSNAGEVT